MTPAELDAKFNAGESLWHDFPYNVSGRWETFSTSKWGEP